MIKKSYEWILSCLKDDKIKAFVAVVINSLLMFAFLCSGSINLYLILKTLMNDTYPLPIAFVNMCVNFVLFIICLRSYWYNRNRLEVLDEQRK